MMNSEESRVLAFKALGDPTRLRIVTLLQSCCGAVALDDDGAVRPVDGPTVGEVCCRLTGAEKITSTVSAHLKELRLAGLITMERRGKNIVCRLNREALAALAAFLTEINTLNTTEEPKTNGCC